MKNKKHLTREQRYEIEVLLRAGKSQKEIAELLDKHKSVISRELKRNSHKRGYSARLAEQYANERKERFRRKRKFTDSIRQKVIRELTQEQWSPEQIVGRARRDGVPIVSHERIYQFVREDKRNGGTLYRHLRHRLKHRKRPIGGKKVVIPGKVSIDMRGDIINNRQRFGDWEIDTIIGKEGKGAILTATERKTGFPLMKKLKRGKNAKCLARELFLLLLPYKNFVHSITSDNGSEFYEHRQIAQQLGADYCFAHPCSSWERGLNEYTNGLIRQYIPKKQPFTNYDDDFIKNVQHKINRRPRKKLNFETPVFRLNREINLSVALVC
jgi:IS30 family transposase